MNQTPTFSISQPIQFAISWSNPLKRIDLTMTVVSYPQAFKNPAHSKATQEAPTTNVFPGEVCIQKMSSEVMQYSLSPGIPKYDGRPPTAMTMYWAVTFSVFPLLSVRQSVCSSTKVANLLKYLISLLLSSFQYPKLRLLIWSLTDSIIFSQL